MCDEKALQICVVVYRLSQLHFNSKPHQTLWSYWESFVDIPYQIWWPYHNGKIVFKWLQNRRKWGNFTILKSYYGKTSIIRAGLNWCTNYFALPNIREFIWKIREKLLCFYAEFEKFREKLLHSCYLYK